MNFKVGIYCRKSSGVEKDNISLLIQKNRGVEWCKENNYEYEIFSEVISGGLIERIEYNKLVSKLKSKELNGIWVFKYDRLERNVEFMIEFRNLYIENKFRFWVGSDEYDFNKLNDKLNISFRSVFGEYERERIKERMIIGKENKLSKGLDIIGNIGFGLKREDGIIKIHNEEGIWVKRIYQIFLYKNVKSYNDVYNRLVKKYDDLNNKITLSLIVKILNNRRYNGFREYIFNEKEYQFEFEKIINDEDYVKVQEKIKYLKSLRKGNLKNDYYQIYSK